MPDKSYKDIHAPLDIRPKGVKQPTTGGISSISAAGGSSSHEAPADAAIEGKGIY